MRTRRHATMLLATLATLAIAAFAAAGCGGDGGGGGGSEDAAALLERAFGEEVLSADVRFELSADLEGVDQLDGPLSLTLEGPYDQESREDLPVLDWDISAEGAGQQLEAGLIVTDDNAFVDYGGQAYEVGAELFGQFSSQFEQQQRSFSPQGLKSLGVDPTKWLEDAEIEDGDDIGGDSTRLVTGSVDVERAIRDVLELLESPAVRQQLEQQGGIAQVPELTDEQIAEVEEAVEELRFEANVDENDVARRTLIEAAFSVPDDADAGGLEGGDLKLEFVLEDVDVDPQLEPPADARPIAELLGQFGLGGGLTPGAPLPPGTVPGE